MGGLGWGFVGFRQGVVGRACRGRAGYCGRVGEGRVRGGDGRGEESRGEQRI